MKLAIAVSALALVAPVYAGDVDNSGLVLPPRQETISSITEYTDYTTWATAVGGSLFSNRYAELGAGVTVTSQYLGVGATYADGDDVTLSHGSATDGMLLDARGRANITFSTPISAIGVNFPGALRIVGYSGASTVFTSSDFAGSGSGFFGGVISSVPFDRVELVDWVDEAVFPDDVFYPGDTVGVEAETWGAVRNLYR